MPVLPSGLPDIVKDDEDLARFLGSRNYFNLKMAKPAAFLPGSDRETSVFRHGDQPRDALWSLSPIKDPFRLHGAAIVKAGDVRAVKLDVIADELPLRHAVLSGWPLDSDPAVQKAQQLLRAAEIASRATLVLVS